MTSKEIVEHYKAFNKITTTHALQLLQDLERLEVLGKHYDKLNEDMNILKNDDKKLYLKFKELEQENEKLKKAIEYEIELLIERRFNAYACDDYEVYNVIDAIIEELKEVL